MTEHVVTTTGSTVGCTCGTSVTLRPGQGSPLPQVQAELAHHAATSTAF